MKLDPKYRYRRTLPHIQKENRAHFVTFRTFSDWRLPPEARDIVLELILHSNGMRMELHALAVLGTHVHMVFTPLLAEHDYPFTFAEIRIPSRAPRRTRSTRH